jgi:DhnA family fructose-bisphosphate aldolase class Ia
MSCVDMMMISDARWYDLLDMRATQPEAIGAALAARTPRALLADDGTTFIIAIDHPARGMVGISGQPFVMANRREVLERTMVALADPGVDGVMATPDILDDLALLGALDGKVAFGSLNRGGLAGSVWELDDQLTAHTVESIVGQNLDGAKMLLRIDLADERTRYTIESCAEWITELAAAKKMAMLEPLPYTTSSDGRAVLDTDDDALVRCVGVASALGASSAYTWLKLPATDQIERVMAATSLPGLILGGAPGPDPESAFDGWRRAMAVPNVRGLVVGRALLYPPDGDVAAAVATAARIVHPSLSPRTTSP